MLKADVGAVVGGYTADLERTFTLGPAPRHRTVGVTVGEGAGAVTVGGGAPIVVQSMTNTDTADIDATVAQVAQLARVGSELVRIPVDRDEAAAAVPKIRERLDRDLDEQQWSDAVVDAETAISREHTMWHAHRST